MAAVTSWYAIIMNHFIVIVLYYRHKHDYTATHTSCCTTSKEQAATQSRRTSWFREQTQVLVHCKCVVLFIIVAYMVCVCTGGY